MKLRRFDKNASSFKNSLNHKKDTYIKYGTLIFSFAVIVFIYVYFTRAAFNSNTDFSVINASVGDFVTDYTLSYYLDNTLVNNAPTPTDDVAFDHVTCDKNATATFDKGEWAASISATEQGTKCKVYFVTDNNAWQLPGGVDLETGMTAIKYVDGKIYKADTSQKWYDYRNHEWANAAILTSTGAAKTTEELDPTTDIYQMYVWIPRYAYKTWDIVDGSSEEHIIPIIFQSATTKNNSEGYITHPAFKFGQTELNGFWVGKFETATNTGIWTSDNNDFCTSIGCANAANIIIKPNVISLTNINIANMFNASRSIESNFDLTSADIDTHMMKNMEWGSIAYLSNSRYGIYNYDETCSNPNQVVNGKCIIFVNNVNVGYGAGTNTYNLTYQWGPTVTGCSAAGVNTGVANATTQTNPTCANNYTWKENGARASTTGNMYGVYDMSGGAWEYVMGNMANSTTTYSYNAKSSGLTTQPEDKYYDKYLAIALDTTTMSDDNQSKVQNRGLIGDATYEVMKTYGSLTGGWNSDYAVFVSSSRPWFSRGGHANNGSYAGVFAFHRHDGGRNTAYSFRVVLTKEG